MKIKNYIQFIKESSGQHEFGCVMLDIPFTNWKEIISEIKEEDVYNPDGTHGIEDFPHLTLLYGLHREVTPEMVKTLLEEFTGTINIEVNGIGIFENKDYDVVKFNVNPNESLQELHDKLSTLPNSDKYPVYEPHITLCYTKKGTGKKYIKDGFRYTFKNLNKVCYSLSNGKIFYFEI